MLGVIFGLGIILALGLSNRKQSDARAVPPTVAHVAGDWMTHSDNGQVEQLIDREMIKGKLSSPIQELSDEEWRKFVDWASRGQQRTITPNYNLGTYLINSRQLSDYGYMRGVRKLKWQGKEVYQGTWVSPHSLESYLSSPSLQYEVFVKILKDHSRAILTRYRHVLGKMLDSEGEVWAKKHVTLTGLLAVAKVAGITGLTKWVNSADDRAKFTATTSAYIEANGIG